MKTSQSFLPLRTTVKRANCIAQHCLQSFDYQREANKVTAVFSEAIDKCQGLPTRQSSATKISLKLNLSWNPGFVISKNRWHRCKSWAMQNVLICDPIDICRRIKKYLICAANIKTKLSRVIWRINFVVLDCMILEIISDWASFSFVINKSVPEWSCS